MQTAAAGLGVTVGSAAGGLFFNVAALPGASFVLTVFQAGAVGFFAGRVREIYQIGAGFGLMGTGIALLSTARTTFVVFAVVGLLAFGMAFISPNLAALISKRGGSFRVGAARGVQMRPTVSVRREVRRAFPESLTLVNRQVCEARDKFFQDRPILDGSPS